jgi:hypothetical protein
MFSAFPSFPTFPNRVKMDTKRAFPKFPNFPTPYGGDGKLGNLGNPNALFLKPAGRLLISNLLDD